MPDSDHCLYCATPEPGPESKNKKASNARVPGDETPPGIIDSDLEDFVWMRGNWNKYLKIVQNVGGRSEEKPVIDLLVPLPPADFTGPSPTLFAESELHTSVETLRSDRLLLIDCSDQSVALAAAHAAIGRLGVTRRLLLNLERMSTNVTADIYQMVAKPIHRTSETIILVDAYPGDRAQQFVGSLFPTGASGANDIRSSLNRMHLRVVCITDPEKLAGRSQKLPFECWSISNLRLLLRPRFPQDYTALEIEITKQRKLGNWSSDENDFRQQLDELIRSDKLKEVVARGGPLAGSSAPAAEYPDPENPLAVAVLYTATFYLNLAPNEFSRVLETLLGDQCIVVSEVVQQRTKEGTFEPVPLQCEKKLVQTWNERTDVVLRECRLVTGRDRKRVINFADVGRRDLLRRHYEEQFGAYVMKQFLAAWDKGLLFDPSDAIAEDLIQLTLDMAAAYPEQLDEDWLCALTDRFCEETENPSWVLWRVSRLLTPMLTQPAPLDGMVAAVLECLLQSGRHGYAFEIVKNLRFYPEFAEFHWLRQIIDRATDDIRLRAYGYVFNALRRRPGILQQLEAWLPSHARDPETYSPSNRAALLIILAYCLETTERFDAASYGTWPSRFPLYAGDRAAVRKSLSTALRSLLHRGTPSVVSDDWSAEQLTLLIAQLISSWVFILFELPDVAAQPSDAAESASLDGFSADEALTILVEEILDTTKAAHQRALRQVMLDYWERMKNILVMAPTVRQDGLSRRHELARKRSAIRKLITEFRRLQRTQRPSAAARATV